MLLSVGIPARWNDDFSMSKMTGLKQIREKIFVIKNSIDFDECAMMIFDHQFRNNSVYHDFIISLGKDPLDISSPEDIPYMPIEFFRNHKVVSGDYTTGIIFGSSGTTGSMQSKHYVSDPGVYEESFLRSFTLFYGNPEDFIITALLPSYIERGGSSLVYMVDNLIKRTGSSHSGFYRDNFEDLIRTINKCKEGGKKILLIGVSFALLDLAEKYSPDLSGVIVMETGGMKGRRKEITRSELHNILKEKLNISSVHSEYGMTELLSQAYSSGDGIFYTPPWMKIRLRDPQDPLTMLEGTGKTGGINIIDLANFNSCSFLSTGDLGRLREDGGFEVLGRFDNSDIRGCNLLTE